MLCSEKNGVRKSPILPPRTLSASPASPASPVSPDSPDSISYFHHPALGDTEMAPEISAPSLPSSFYFSPEEYKGLHDKLMLFVGSLHKFFPDSPLYSNRSILEKIATEILTHYEAFWDQNGVLEKAYLVSKKEPLHNKDPALNDFQNANRSTLPCSIIYAAATCSEIPTFFAYIEAPISNREHSPFVRMGAMKCTKIGSGVVSIAGNIFNGGVLNFRVDPLVTFSLTSDIVRGFQDSLARLSPERRDSFIKTYEIHVAKYKHTLAKGMFPIEKAFMEEIKNGIFFSLRFGFTNLNGSRQERARLVAPFLGVPVNVVLETISSPENPYHTFGRRRGTLAAHISDPVSQEILAGNPISEKKPDGARDIKTSNYCAHPHLERELNIIDYLPGPNGQAMFTYASRHFIENRSDTARTRLRDLHNRIFCFALFVFQFLYGLSNKNIKMLFPFFKPPREGKASRFQIPSSFLEYFKSFQGKNFEKWGEEFFLLTPILEAAFNEKYVRMYIENMQQKDPGEGDISAQFSQECMLWFMEEIIMSALKEHEDNDKVQKTLEELKKQFPS